MELSPIRTKHQTRMSAVNRLNANGSLTNVTLPNYTTPAYPKFGITVAAGPNAASGNSQAVLTQEQKDQLNYKLDL